MSLYGSGGGSGSNIFGGGSSGGSSKRKGLTPFQRLQLINTIKASKKVHDKGWFSTALHGATGGLMHDVVGPTGHAFAVGTHYALKPGNAILSGIEASNKAAGGHGIYDLRSPFFNLALGKNPFHHLNKQNQALLHGIIHGWNHPNPNTPTNLLHSTEGNRLYQGLNKAHLGTANRIIGGSAISIGYDPVSYLGFGIGSAAKSRNLQRLIEAPKSYKDIQRASKGLDAIKATAHPHYYQAAKAVNTMDKQLYTAAKAAAKARGEAFTGASKRESTPWMHHLLDEAPKLDKKSLVIPDQIAERDAQAMYSRNAFDLLQPRKAYVRLGNQRIPISSNLAKSGYGKMRGSIFSNSRRYGPYYALYQTALHGGLRSDVGQRLIKSNMPKEDIASTIKQLQANTAKRVLGRAEGVPLRVPVSRYLTDAITKEHFSLLDAARQAGGKPGPLATINAAVVKHLTGIELPRALVLKLRAVERGSQVAFTPHEQDLYNHFRPAMEQTARKIMAAGKKGPEALADLGKAENPAAAGLEPLASTKAYKDIGVSPAAKGALAKLAQDFRDTGVESAVMNHVMNYRAMFKRGVTAANPFGYRIRNTGTDVYNAKVEGVPVNAMTRGIGKAVPQIRQYSRISDKLASGTPLTLKERQQFLRVRQMEHLGILSGLFAKDIQEDKIFQNVAEPKTGFQILKSERRAGVPRVIHAWATGATKVNETGENAGRMSHFNYRMRKMHESPYEAASAVKRAHFDYQDVTPAEQNILKTIYPFYTWSRKNIPFQLKALLKNPGVMTKFNRIGAQTYAAAGGQGNQGEVADYVAKNPAAIRLPLGPHMWLNTPAGSADLQDIEHPRDAIKHHLGPPFNVLYSGLTGKDAFTGADLRGKTVPTNPLVGRLLAKLHVPGAKPVTKTIQGQPVTTPGISDWLNLLFAQVPNTQLLTGANPVSAGRRGLPSFDIPGGMRFPTGPALSYFAGQSVSHQDQTLAQQINATKIKDLVKQDTKDAYATGRLKINRKRKLSPFQLQLQRIMNGP